jgi:hypothetical protein
MPYEIGVVAELTSEKLPGEVVVGDGRIEVANAGVGVSVLRQLGHRPD